MRFEIRVWSVGLALASVCGLTQAADPPASIRFVCEGAAVGAAVTVNNKFKGECPIDVDVAPGSIAIRANKKISGKEEVYEEVVRLGSGARKRIELRFGSQANTAAAIAQPAIDYRAIAMQRYEAEMREYQRSVDGCRPLYEDHVRKIRQEYRDAVKSRRELCLSRGEPAEYGENCGLWDTETRESNDRLVEARNRVERLDRESATEWCQDKFTRPVMPK